jgi:hypothetical protein
MQNSTYYTLSIVVFMLFFMDEIFYTDMKSGLRFRNTVDLSQSGEIVWNGPPSNAFSRRSVFNPTMIFHSGYWHVFTRYTRGRRFLQCMMEYSLDNDVIEIAGKEYRASVRYFMLDRDFRVLTDVPVFVPMVPSPGFVPPDPLFWQGEDPRVYRNESNQIRLQATLHQGDVRKLAQGRIVRREGMLIWDIERIIQSGVSEKNWSALPLLHKGSQVFLTHVAPSWRMGTLDRNGELHTFLETTKYQKWLSKLRCTSCCIPFRKDTLLTCLHTTHPYQTVLCEIDSKTLLPLRLSLPLQFHMDDSYIEFPSGLATKDNKIYFGLGLNDTFCEIRGLSTDEVERLLVKVL